MHADALPELWRLALEDIAGNRRSIWTGAACLPGGWETVAELIKIGAVEPMHADGRYVTLTPWGARTLCKVELYEPEDEVDPVWMLSDVVANDPSVGRRPLVSRGMHGHERLPLGRFTYRDPDPFDEADAGPEPEAVVDEFSGEPVVLFAGSDGSGIPLYRDASRRKRAGKYGGGGTRQAG